MRWRQRFGTREAVLLVLCELKVVRPIHALHEVNKAVQGQHKFLHVPFNASSSVGTSSLDLASSFALSSVMQDQTRPLMKSSKSDERMLIKEGHCPVDMELSGTVSSGLGRAHVFMAQPHYQDQFRTVLGNTAGRVH